MRRLYSSSGNISGDKIAINDKQQVHHAKDVLRLKEDDEIIIFDDKGNEYCSILDKFSDKGMLFKIIGKKVFIPEPSKAKITVGCSMPKGSNMDKIVDKLTQLGVDRIIPLETERVILRLDKHKRSLRQERWSKIALNASQQSQRGTLPILEPIKDIKELLSASQSFDLKLIPTLTGERRPLKEVLQGAKPNNILVIIGPEGDFTSEEVNLARKAGFIPVTLGDLVLRVETAAVAVASFIRFTLDSTS